MINVNWYLNICNKNFCLEEKILAIQFIWNKKYLWCKIVISAQLEGEVAYKSWQVYNNIKMPFLFFYCEYFPAGRYTSISSDTWLLICLKQMILFHNGVKMPLWSRWWFCFPTHIVLQHVVFLSCFHGLHIEKTKDNFHVLLQLSLNAMTPIRFF